MPGQTIHFDLAINLGWPFKGTVSGSVFLSGAPAMPGVLEVIQTEKENDMLLFDVILPSPGAGDVVKRELTIARDGVDPIVLETDGDAAALSSKAPQDSELTLTLVDIDDAGNRSEPRVQTVTLADTIAPPQPGEMGIVVTGEESDA